MRVEVVFVIVIVVVLMWCEDVYRVMDLVWFFDKSFVDFKMNGLFIIKFLLYKFFCFCVGDKLSFFVFSIRLVMLLLFVFCNCFFWELVSICLCIFGKKFWVRVIYLNYMYE